MDCFGLTPSQWRALKAMKPYLWGSSHLFITYLFSEVPGFLSLNHRTSSGLFGWSSRALLVFREAIWLISLESKVKSKMLRFSTMRSFLEVFGIATIPLCVCHLKITYATLLPCFLAICVRIGLFRIIIAHLIERRVGF